MKMMVSRFSRFLMLACWVVCLPGLPVEGVESWQTALAGMPLGGGVRQLSRTNCVEIMLRAFQSNQLVKALVFMPGATDEFYMFRRAKADLTNPAPSLLDAVIALTNQTFIRASFYPPLLLLHTDEDPLEPLFTIEHQATARKFRRTQFLPHAIYNDRDWNDLQPILKKTLKADVRPWRHYYESWHFYRHSFAAWNLTGWEALEAVAMAGKTKFAVLRNRLVFEGDIRERGKPHLEGFVPETMPRSALF